MRNLTLRQLRTVQAICRLGKINLAAEDLGLTGPALTLQIQQLERDAEVQLFDRTRGGMVPTAFGLAFLEAAREIEESLNSLEDSISAMKGLRTGRLRLGVVSTGKYFAPQLIAAFRKQVPAIEINLFIGNRAEIITKLRDHEIDIALMGRPPRDFEVRSQVFGDHPLVFIAPADHPLAGVLDISRERIAQEQFILRERGSGTRISLEIFLSDTPRKLEDLGTEMGSNETIKQAVIAGLGLAFISAHTIEQEIKLGRLVILDVVDTPIRRQWFSVSRLDRTTTPAMQAFEQFLLTSGARHLPVVSKPYPANVFG
ncbi:LysR family transcriptional regulator [Agrobacterium sp. a22-2]|uniref:LysR family transcriptional regulator n=1 Tax=Agrobacterium sp. a22-2 TaxID=2283840 RepID=UPI00144523E2|nr:LysR family transcriptional regulator [Agrobacterium sp. a22-2]NKN38807.1 LysR family transcriptional regulator [Agrobacterium sp. a22-2]